MLSDAKLAELRERFPCACCKGEGWFHPCPTKDVRCRKCLGQSGIDWPAAVEGMGKDIERIRAEVTDLTKQLQALNRTSDETVRIKDDIIESQRKRLARMQGDLHTLKYLKRTRCRGGYTPDDERDTLPKPPPGGTGESGGCKP